jgi:hypothetical protein
LGPAGGPPRPGRRQDQDAAPRRRHQDKEQGRRCVSCATIFRNRRPPLAPKAKAYRLLFGLRVTYANSAATYVRRLIRPNDRIAGAFDRAQIHPLSLGFSPGSPTAQVVRNSHPRDRSPPFIYFFIRDTDCLGTSQGRGCDKVRQCSASRTQIFGKRPPGPNSQNIVFWERFVKKKIQQIVFVIVDELKIIIDSLSEILSIINCFNCGGTRVNLSGDIVEKH